jgi:hypothetical protein
MKNKRKMMMIGALCLFGACSNDPAPPTADTLPTVEWFRHELRAKLAHLNGVPVDNTKPIAYVSGPQWFLFHMNGDADPGKWTICMEYEGQTYEFFGHGPAFGNGIPVGTLHTWDQLQTGAPYQQDLRKAGFGD